MTKVAVGGPFIHNDAIMIEASAQDHPYRVWHNLTMITDGANPLTPYTALGGNVTITGNKNKVDIDFPNHDVKLSVTLYGTKIGKRNGFMKALITMKQIPGQDGQCGAFNGDSSDDTTSKLWSRYRKEVPFTKRLIKYT
jgi:hypothetical protein